LIPTKVRPLKAAILSFIERNLEKYMVIRLVQGFILGAAVTGLIIFLAIKVL